jgi:hypothetical protein
VRLSKKRIAQIKRWAKGEKGKDFSRQAQAEHWRRLVERTEQEEQENYEQRNLIGGS